MLKQLIQLFAEKFLVCKKEWVGSQAFPMQRVDLSTELTEYTPPADGFLGIYKAGFVSNAFIDMYCRDSGNRIISRQNISIVSGVASYSQVIPVKKGYKVTLGATQNSISELWFAPSEGSES
ncbi:hypothetical protein [Parasutterella sp.]|uniref:hypothetical protein n=1 Tax=Parasutterella sp. TaxID=2049037 RepID=UPI003520D81B